MAQSRARNSDKVGWAQHFGKGLQEGALIGFITLCIYVLIALLSYDSNDPGWSFTGTSGDVTNLVGTSGAWLADVLLFLFGYLAYLFPMLLAFQAWMIFRERDRRERLSWMIFAVKVMGLLLTTAAGAALASMHFYLAGVNLPSGSGGILGDAIIDMSVPAFSYVGSTLILLAVFLFGITMFTSLSWLNVLEMTGRACLAVLSWFISNAEKYRSWRVQKLAGQKSTASRRQALEEQMQRKAQRSAPKIESVKPRAEASVRVQKERQGNLFKIPAVDGLPALHLLDSNLPDPNRGYSPEDLEAMSRLLELKLNDYGIIAEVVAVYPGPVITRFEIQPAAGVKVSRISGLVKDLARSLAVISVRVVEVIPGKSVVGIEIPNVDREVVKLSEVLNSRAYDQSHSALTLALGHDISGSPLVVDLAKMPHLLVAGTTGSGKSVALNAMILSLLFKASPETVRMIMVDPKMLELSVYEGIPHLLTPVVTDMKDAANALRWCVAEMERRYKLMAALGVRNITGFNRKVTEAEKIGKPILNPLWAALDPIEEDERASALETLPFIVVVIDEFADMMMIVGKKVEELIARIAQKARAAGIHLILATQRPSVDVITGLIKANIPTRIAFQVSSRIDSRTILDQGGAEQLLGHGDMLYLPAGSPVPTRVHGAFVDDDEVHRVVRSWKELGQPNYLQGVLDNRTDRDVLPNPSMALEAADDESDPLYDEAVEFVTETRRASISAVQRKLRVGYNRAARMVEAMEKAGIVSEMNSNGSRAVLANAAPVS